MSIFCFDKFRNTALKHRRTQIAVGYYGFISFARFALSCEISLRKIYILESGKSRTFCFCLIISQRYYCANNARTVEDACPYNFICDSVESLYFYTASSSSLALPCLTQFLFANRFYKLRNTSLKLRLVALASQ